MAATVWVEMFGYPVVATAKDAGLPANNTTRFGVVMLGASLTVKVRAWVAVPEEEVSVTRTGYWPPVPTAGVPLMDCEQVKQSNVGPEKYKRPLGRAPTLTVPMLSEIPNVPAVPTVKVAALALVITGAFRTAIA